MGDGQNKEAVVKKILTTGPEMPEVPFGRFQRAPSKTISEQVSPLSSRGANQ